MRNSSSFYLYHGFIALYLSWRPSQAPSDEKAFDCKKIEVEYRTTFRYVVHHQQCRVSTLRPAYSSLEYQNATAEGVLWDIFLFSQ